MLDTANKAVVRRYYDEVLNQRKVDVLDQIAVEDYVEHDPFPGQGNGLADLKARVAALQHMFNPLRFTVEDVIAEGDKVVARNTVTGTHQGEFMGVGPTGKSVTYNEIFIFRFADGLVVETWGVVDVYAQMKQIGVIPA